MPIVISASDFACFCHCSDSSSTERLPAIFLLITIQRVALTGESELTSCQMLSSVFASSSPSPLGWHKVIPPVWHACIVDYMLPAVVLPSCLLLGDSAAVRYLVSTQSPGNHEQMKQAVPKDTIITHLETSGLSHSLSEGLLLWEKKQFCCKCIQVERDNEHKTASHLLSTPRCGVFLFLKLVSEMIYL